MNERHDPIVESAVQRDKPVSAKRVRVLLDRLALAERIVARARMWAAHDDVLRDLIREWSAE